MKFVTLHQPWASLVACGAKRIETRSWSTSYRGPLGICAAAAFPQGARSLCWQPPFATALIRAGYSDIRDLPLGVVVAVVDLVGCVHTTAMTERQIGGDRQFGDFTFGRHAWLFDRLTRLPRPIRCKGMRRLWTDDHLRQRVLDVLRGG